jgi:hypothetical protein
MQKISFRLLAAATPWLIATQLAAQTLTLPPAGGNQRSTASQSMGLVRVGVEYNSVDVHSPTGEDRTGKIWGQLVPYGLVDLGYNDGKLSPWRAGSNENTVFTTSHDVQIEGKPLPAGRYGLHMIPGQKEWTVIFSKRNDAWGSYFYDESEDALRVVVRGEPAEYSEWLDFEFLDRQLDTCLVALHWEKLRVPFRVRVPDTVGLYVASIKDQLKGSAAWSWQDYDAAAQFVLQRDPEGKYMEQALAWSERSVTPLFGGDRNFTTLSTKAQVLERLQRSEAAAARQEALQAASSPVQIHGYGRSLQGQKKMQEALEVFQLNAKRFPGVWPVEVGLMRGYAGVGNSREAIAHGKKALAAAPDEASRQNVQVLLTRLEKGEPLG